MRKWKWFTEREVKGLDPALVSMLDEAREIARTSFVITSGFRKGDPRTHGLEPGKGVDLKCPKRASVKRQKIYDALRDVGFNRIGVYDKHLHADIATKAEGFPQNVTWWGKSK